MLLDQRMGLGGPMVIGQVRATATDLLRGIGLTYEEATRRSMRSRRSGGDVLAALRSGPCCGDKYAADRSAGRAQSGHRPVRTAHSGSRYAARSAPPGHHDRVLEVRRRRPFIVRIVQPSSSSNTRRVPDAMIGSIVITRPGGEHLDASGSGQFGIVGSSCTARPTP